MAAESKHDDHDSAAGEPHGHGGEGGGGGHGGGGHGGGGEDHHEGAPEWLISFADNVTLMMGFFVIMLAMNMGPKTGPAQGGETESPVEGTELPDEPSARTLDIAIAIREAFNNGVDMNSTNPEDQDLIRRMREREIDGAARPPGPDAKQNPTEGVINADYYKLAGTISFQEGSTDLTDASRRAAALVADKLRGLRVLIEVRGHVSQREAASQPDGGLQLSFQRAVVIARILADNRIDWRQLVIVIRSDNDRLVAIPSAQARDVQNSRVEIVQTDRLMSNYVPTEDSGRGSVASPAAAGSGDSSH